MDFMSYDPIAETVSSKLSYSMQGSQFFSLFWGYILIDFERLYMIVLSASLGGFVLLKSVLFFLFTCFGPLIVCILQLEFANTQDEEEAGEEISS